MARVRPFTALRPAPESAQLVASVPYDVVNTKEARELAAGNPLSLLNITRSEIAFDDAYNPYAPEIYTAARKKLDEITAAAPLLMEAVPSYYFYRLIMGGQHQTGLCAAYSVDDYDADIIMKHEKTRKEKEDDRTNHITITGAQTGPVFLTYRGEPGIDAIAEVVTKSTSPVYDFTAPDGIQHTVWIVPAMYNDNITEAIGGVDRLYIADGHHRAASASRARAKKQRENPAHSGNEEYNYFLAVLFPAPQLRILPYYRVVKDLNGLSLEDFLNAVSEKFSVEQINQKEPAQQNHFCMYLAGHWYYLTVRDSILASNSLSNSVGEKLDVSILQNFLLQPVLGIDDPRTNKRIDFVGGIRGTSELERLVDHGGFAVAFSLYPVTVDDLMRISDAGEIMPPKSTWFEPKLRDGLLVHLI